MESILYKADGSSENIKPKDGKEFTLEEMKGYIGGGYVELIPLYREGLDTLHMFGDEDGKRKNFPINEQATTLFQTYYERTDYVVGDIVVCEPKMFR